MDLPNFITHYYERIRGPFLNICDLDDASVSTLIESERHLDIPFNRFAIGSQFMEWRRAADDLLVKSYTEKFGTPPVGRPFFGTLGRFDRTHGYVS